MDNKDMQQRFDMLVKKLTEKRTVLFLKMLNENKSYEKRIKDARIEFERNNALGFEEQASINKEEIIIFSQSFSKNLFEMNILVNLLYENVDFKNN